MQDFYLNFFFRFVSLSVFVRPVRISRCPGCATKIGEEINFMAFSVLAHKMNKAHLSEEHIETKLLVLVPLHHHK